MPGGFAHRETVMLGMTDTLAGSKLTRFRVCLSSLQYTLKTERFDCGNDEETIELTRKVQPFHSTENNREGRLVYK